MNYFEFYPGDYRRDTGRLSLAEHGAYLLLMADYYASEKPLPAELGPLYRITGSQGAVEQKAVRAVADRFFPVSDDGMRHNARADAEIEKAQKRINAARENGKKGGRKPADNPVGTPTGTRPVTRRATQQTTHSGEALQTPDPKDQEQPSSDDEGVAGKPAPPSCPQSEIVALYHEVLPELARVRDWTPDRQAFLRARWKESPERQTAGWWRGFFEYVRECPFLMGQGASSADRDPFFADLEWLVRPKNFRKVIEGKYERRRA